MTGKELTPRQIRERTAHEAEKVKPEPHMSTRDYLRKKAGWPALKVK